MRQIHVAVVAAGGVVGTSARWVVVEAIDTTEFPWALLTVNVVGSFVLGFVALATAAGPRELVRLGVGIGFCGGFTTFSGFAVVAADLGRDGRTATATVFVIVSVVAAIAAVGAGATLHRTLVDR